MAADDQRKEQRKQGRVGPSVDTSKTSRVSKAAGSIGSESMRIEQRANNSATKQRANKPVSQRREQGNKQSPKKGSSPNRPGPAPSNPVPADSRLTGNLHRTGPSLPHHPQQTGSSLLPLAL